MIIERYGRKEKKRKMKKDFLLAKKEENSIIANFQHCPHH